MAGKKGRLFHLDRINRLPAFPKQRSPPPVNTCSDGHVGRLPQLRTHLLSCYGGVTQRRPARVFSMDAKSPSVKRRNVSRSCMLERANMSSQELNTPRWGGVKLLKGGRQLKASVLCEIWHFSPANQGTCHSALFEEKPHLTPRARGTETCLWSTMAFPSFTLNETLTVWLSSVVVVDTVS